LRGEAPCRKRNTLKKRKDGRPEKIRLTLAKEQSGLLTRPNPEVPEEKRIGPGKGPSYSSARVRRFAHQKIPAFQAKKMVVKREKEILIDKKRVFLKER